MLFGHYKLTAGRTLNGVASMGFSGAFSAFNHLAALSALVDLKQNIKLDFFFSNKTIKKTENIQKTIRTRSHSDSTCCSVTALWAVKQLSDWQSRSQSGQRLG